MDYLVGHMVGDFLFQTHWMAINKKRQHLHCFIHVSLYCLSIWLFTGWPWWAVLLTFWCHFIQDRTQLVAWLMDHTGKADFRKQLAPWAEIVVDNTLHLVQLYLTAQAVAGQFLWFRPTEYC